MLKIVERDVVKIVLVAAILVVAARLAAPFEIGKDQALQLQAAHRLVDGEGLTTIYFSPPSPDITERPSPATLTWWPPGFSLLMAGLLATGLPLEIALRLVYAVVTLLGWLAWALLAARFLAAPIDAGRRGLFAGLLLAPFLPIFTTPNWQGTDLFLWASLPAILLLLLPSAPARVSLRAAAVAGLLFGALVALRYASLFLALAAFGIVLFANGRQWVAALKQYAVFLVAAGIFIGPLAVFLTMASPDRTPVPEIVSPETTTSAPGDEEAARPSPAPPAAQPTATKPRRSRPVKVISYLRAVSVVVVGSPLLIKASNVVDSLALNAAVGMTSLLVVFATPLVLLRYRRSEAFDDRADEAVALSLFPVALVVFLATVAIVTDTNFIGVTRYYEPLVLCIPLVAYDVIARRHAAAPIRAGATALLAIFALFVFVFPVAQGALLRRHGTLVETVLGYTPSRLTYASSTSEELDYPSGRVFSLKERSRAVLGQLLRENPDAIFYLANYPFFVYEEASLEGGSGPPPDVRRLPDFEYFAEARTSRPVTVFWVLDTTTPVGFIPDSAPRLVFSDGYEKTAIYTSRYEGAGTLWELDPNAPAR